MARFGHVVVKTFFKNFYKSLSYKGINAKMKRPQNEQKCAEIDRNARVLNRNDQERRIFNTFEKAALDFYLDLRFLARNLLLATEFTENTE